MGEQAIGRGKCQHDERPEQGRQHSDCRQVEQGCQAVDRHGHPKPQGRIDFDDIAIKPCAFVDPPGDPQLRGDVGIDPAPNAKRSDEEGQDTGNDQRP